MQVRFLLGPAGAGKTRLCIREAEACLETNPDGPDLLFIAPKQATFQVERQMLTNHLTGFTRLHILSFERLARHIFDRFGLPPPSLLSEQGRIMVLGAILREPRLNLSIFKTSSGVLRLAHEISDQIREFQRNGISPDRLHQIVSTVGSNSRLGQKLADLAYIFEHFTHWLATNDLKDFESLLDTAASLLEKNENPIFQAIWLDGFAQMTPQELRLLLAVSRRAEKINLAFCCESESEPAWFSHWAGIVQLIRRSRSRFVDSPEAIVTTERLGRSECGRFAQAPDLAHLERNWDTGIPYKGEANNIELIACSSPELEAIYVAREILKFVRTGGRFKEAAVLMRSLETHHEVIRHVFERYEIPFFLDHRNSVNHHPLVELTRSALRVVCDHWQHDDWFALLKTGLMGVPIDDIHWLENLARENGWTGEMWQTHLPFEGDRSSQLESLRRRLVSPMKTLSQVFSSGTTGPQLSVALQSFWQELGISDSLEKWQAEQSEGSEIHQAVWTQVKEWINSIRLAFPTQALKLEEWIPLLEHGLSNLTVGVVPPAIDQVLVGALDRSRNPDLKLALCIGFNDGVFPKPPETIGLFSEAELKQMDEQDCIVNGRVRDHLAQEQFYGYIACTRARNRLVITFAETDSEGKSSRPSPFVLKIEQLFPNLRRGPFNHQSVESEWQHASEIIPQLLPDSWFDRDELNRYPVFARLIDDVQSCRVIPVPDALPVELAEQLYGRELHTSVSKFEDFPKCPFKFFVASGLKAKERKIFELDSRRQGSFQHKLLEEFHKELQIEKKHWREIERGDAQARVRRIAERIIPDFDRGIMASRPENQFLAHIYTSLIEDFVAQVIQWMDQQWEFNPMQVELGFGNEDGLGRWRIDLSHGKSLIFHGRIDRIDLWTNPATGTTHYVVIDYKSGVRKLTRLLFERGMEQQLVAYLLAIKGSEKAHELFKATKLEPAGGFFVSLRPDPGKGGNRNEVLNKNEETKSDSYKHFGLFDFSLINQFDRPRKKDQIGYRVTSDPDKLHRGGAFGAMYAVDFTEALVQSEQRLRDMAEQVFQGKVAVFPYKFGCETACKYCEFTSVCRFDSWRDPFNVIK